jgi:hypothetical protein
MPPLEGPRRSGKSVFVAIMALVAVFVVAACSDDGTPEAQIAVGSPTPKPTQDQLLAEADEFALGFAATPSPTPTRVPSPTPTPAPTPTPTPTPVAVVTHVFIPEAEAEAMTEGGGVPEATIGFIESPDAAGGSGDGPAPNLAVFTPKGWDGPLVISGKSGRTQSGPVDVSLDLFITFAIANLGDADTGSDFFVDLYFDEYLVQRFPMERSLSAGRFVSWSDFERLGSMVRLTPGPHTLRLVVDPTHLVDEPDESDNAWELTVEWTGTASPRASAGANKGVNLTAFSPPEWGVPLVASAFAEDLEILRLQFERSPVAEEPLDGPLSAQGETFVSYGISNTGLLSQPGDVFVDIFFDDVLVLRDRWTQMLAQQRVNRNAWIGLGDVVRLTPGRHTLRMVIDPNDLVAETDETDNVFVREFEWSPDPARAADRPVREPAELKVPDVLLLPNLVPGWLWGWDGPIVLDTVAGTNTDGSLSLDAPVFVDMVVFNKSIVAAEPDFVVDVFFDGELVHILDLAGPSPARSFRVVQDWNGLLRNVQVTPGPHTLKIVIDPDDRVREADETDNVFEKTFVWTQTKQPVQAPIAYTDAQLAEAFEGLAELIDGAGPVLNDDGTGEADLVLRIADAGFFLMTGTSFRDGQMNVRVLTRPEYLDWIDDSYADLFALDDGAVYPALARSRERDKNISLAKKQRRFGRIDIAVDGGHPFGDVLNSLIHELGHALQDRLNPAQTESGDSLELSAIREAQAQQLERVFWLTIEEFTGEKFTRFPGYDGYFAFIDASISTDLASLTQSEHSLGRMVQWLAVLADPNLAGLREELASQGALSRESAFALYLYLVRIDPAVATEYVVGLLTVLEPAAADITAIAQSRLQNLPSPLDEGSPYLRHPALLSP